MLERLGGDGEQLLCGAAGWRSRMGAAGWVQPEGGCDCMEGGFDCMEQLEGGFDERPYGPLQRTKALCGRVNECVCETREIVCARVRACEKQESVCDSEAHGSSRRHCCLSQKVWVGGFVRMTHGWM